MPTTITYAHRIAATELARSHRTRFPTADVVAEILARADAGADHATIATAMNITTGGVKRVLDAAQRLANDPPRPPGIIDPNAWYTPAEAADALPTTVCALAMQRHRQRPPEFQRHSSHYIEYRGADLIVWRDAGMPPTWSQAAS